MCGSNPNVSEADRTMIIGSTGFIGRFVAESSLKFGRPTYLLVQSRPTSPSKAAIIESLQDKGAIIIHGSIEDRDLMEKVLKEHKIEVVISAVGGAHISTQFSLVDAIKAVGTVKRFLPSEFGHDMDRADPVEPALTMYEEKRRVRRYIEEAGVPYTYICCNSIAAWPYHDNHHPADVLPPLDTFHVYGDGTVKAYFVAGDDIGKFTIKSIDDVRTLNKTLHFRPSGNLLNINELASLWEEKIGRELPRVTVSEDDLLTAAKEMPIPQSIVAALTHDIFIIGCQVNYSLDKPTDVEVVSLYPDTPFRTIDECFKDFARSIGDTPKVVKQPISNDAIIGDTPKVVQQPISNDAIIVPNSKPEALAITAA